MILRKCAPNAEKTIRSIFETEPFGALARLATQKLPDVLKRVTRQELEDEGWLRLLARLSDRSYEELRAIVFEFLETDIFTISAANCVTFLDPHIESWDIDLATFAMEIVSNRRLAPEHLKRIEFVERESSDAVDAEPGLQGFLNDPSLSCDVTAEEIEFLKALKFARKRPTPLYYYRELLHQRQRIWALVAGLRKTTGEEVAAATAAARHYSARCEQDVATIVNDLTVNVPLVFLSSSLTAPSDTSFSLPVVPVVPVAQ